MATISRRAFLGGVLVFGADALLIRPAAASREGPALLLDCHVAGTTYRPRRLADVEPLLIPGAALALRREPANVADPLAIAIDDLAGRHLGYVPRARNEVLARLMDAGCEVGGRLESKAWVDDWLRLDVSVFLVRL